MQSLNHKYKPQSEASLNKPSKSFIEPFVIESNRRTVRAWRLAWATPRDAYNYRPVTAG